VELDDVPGSESERNLSARVELHGGPHGEHGASVRRDASWVHAYDIDDVRVLLVLTDDDTATKWAIHVVPPYDSRAWPAIALRMSAPMRKLEA